MVEPIHIEEVVENPIPHSWPTIALGLVGAISVLVIAASLWVRIAAQRPVDLRDLSLETSELVRVLLSASLVPERNIVLQGPQLNREDGVHVYYFEYKVAVPGNLNTVAVAALIERDLLDKGLSVLSTGGASSGKRLNISWRNVSLGSVVLDGRALPRMALDDDVANRAAREPARNESFWKRKVVEASEKPKIATPVETKVKHVQIAVVRPDDRGWLPPVAKSVAIVEPDAITKLASASMARLAIIVDDGGYGGAVTDSILALDPRLTLSILPNTPVGRRTAEAAVALGFEVMLHMPMQNNGSKLLHDGQLNLGMGEDEIRRLTRDALSQVPGAVGVNNHTGSKFTSVARGLALFMEEVLEQDLYFVDSVTVADSRAYEIARAFGVPSASRDLFLDNESDPEAIRGRFRELVELAKSRGSAIGICHFRANSAAVLAEVLPGLAAEGVQLVHASELTR